MGRKVMHLTRDGDGTARLWWLTDRMTYGSGSWCVPFGQWSGLELPPDLARAAPETPGDFPHRFVVVSIDLAPDEMQGTIAPWAHPLRGEIEGPDWLRRKEVKDG